MTEDKSQLRCFVIAGEASGDRIGADFMVALRDQYENELEFQGIGGAAMQAAGLRQSLFDMNELAVMGLSEVLPKLLHIRRRIDETIQAIQAWQPDIVISIDAPDFGLRVQRRLNKVIDPQMRPYQVHYVAPTVWAWRAGRAAKMANYLDHVLCLYPFEPAYFRCHGLKADFVGHPVMESTVFDADPGAFREKHNISAGTRCVGLLLGSRRGELKRTAPYICAAAQRYAAETHDNIAFILPTLPHLETHVAELVRDIPAPVYISSDSEDKWAAFRTCDCAIAVSGTVGLELAVADVPHCIAYRTTMITYWLLSSLVKVDYAHMVNIMNDKAIVPEFLQSRATASALHNGMLLLLDNKDIRQRQMNAFQTFRDQLLPPQGDWPSQAAARAILQKSMY